MKIDEPHGRTKGYVKCWNCNGFIGKQLLDEDSYNNTCPLCEATGLLD
jgi:Zn finger protein HypA/HybF involved in hydrogenase expression